MWKDPWVKTSPRRLRQVARVKTSLRRPCYLSKKKRRKKKTNKKTRITSLWKLHAGVLRRRASLSTQSQGSSPSCQEISSALPPRILLSFRKVHAQFWLARVSTGRCRFLQEDAVFYRKAQFLQEDATSTGRSSLLQEAQISYRKSRISTGNFL